VTQLLEAAQQEGTSSSKADGDDENMMAMVDLRIETKASSLEDQIRTLGELCKQSRRAFAEEALKQADSEVTSYALVGQVDELRARLDALQVGQPYPTIEMDPFFFLIV
jgi:polyhydroxyalkanoate synthesis regulator protein